MNQTGLGSLSCIWEKDEVVMATKKIKRVNRIKHDWGRRELIEQLGLGPPRLAFDLRSGTKPVMSRLW